MPQPEIKELDELAGTELQHHQIDLWRWKLVAEFTDGVVIAKDGRGYYQVLAITGAYVREADAKAYRRVFYRARPEGVA
jgi:hypothetical protein